MLGRGWGGFFFRKNFRVELVLMTFLFTVWNTSRLKNFQGNLYWDPCALEGWSESMIENLFSKPKFRLLRVNYKEAEYPPRRTKVAFINFSSISQHKSVANFTISSLIITEPAPSVYKSMLNTNELLFFLFLSNLFLLKKKSNSIETLTSIPLVRRNAYQPFNSLSSKPTRIDYSNCCSIFFSQCLFLPIMLITAQNTEAPLKARQVKSFARMTFVCLSSLVFGQSSFHPRLSHCSSDQSQITNT